MTMDSTTITPGKEPIVKRRRQDADGREIDDDSMFEVVSQVEGRQYQ